MYYGALETDKVIAAFRHAVPDTFVRDNRGRGGFINVCRGVKDIRWNDQKSAGRVYRQTPAETLLSLPRGFIAAATQHIGLALHRPGWRVEFRKARHLLTEAQMRRITKFLRSGELFEGIRA